MQQYSFANLNSKKKKMPSALLQMLNGDTGTTKMLHKMDTHNYTKFTLAWLWKTYGKIGIIFLTMHMPFLHPFCATVLSWILIKVSQFLTLQNTYKRQWMQYLSIYQDLNHLL